MTTIINKSLKLNEWPSQKVERTMEMHCSNKIDIYELDLLSVQINEWLWCLKADIPKYINFSVRAYTKTAKIAMQWTEGDESKQ
jgi:hypothetical protein